MSTVQLNSVLKQALGSQTINLNLGQDAGTPYGLSSNSMLKVDSSNIKILENSAKSAADKVMSQLASAEISELFNCGATVSLGNAICIQNFVKNFGAKLFRRPLSDLEIKKYVDFYNANKLGSASEGFNILVEYLMMSPGFLYASEIGEVDKKSGLTSLTGLELASAISLFIENSAPDVELIEAAVSGSLEDPLVLKAQIQRLLTTKGGEFLYTFVYDWLNLDDLTLEGKEGIESILVNSTYSKEKLRNDMLNEISLLSMSVINDHSGQFNKLLFNDTSRINKSLAKIYGLPLADYTNNLFTETVLNDSQRLGLFTSAAYLNTFSGGTTHIQRGSHLNTDVMCISLAEFSDSPMAGDLDNPPKPGNDPTKTARENFQAHSTLPCAGCHTVMDPPGWGLGNFNNLGQFLATDIPSNKTIDASGEIKFTSGAVAKFASPIEMLTGISDKIDLRYCFADKMHRHYYGLPTKQQSSCEVKKQTKVFSASDSIIDLVVSTLSSEYAIKRIATYEP
ncbi:MAG: DUF1592 domain-containing protein [Oligoflexales bacterium]|nr:DUF1592 domain-containing protein [Oligoflexales bacterium]